MNFIQRLKSDFTYVTGLMAILKYTEDITPFSENLLPDDWEKSVDAHSQNVAVIFDGQETTYGELDLRANKFANWAIKQGIQQGDCVALLMGNRPDYLAFWLGITKIGACCALINNQLASQPLAHCLNIVEAKILVMGDARWEQYVSAQSYLDVDVPAWVLGDIEGGHGNLETELSNISSERPDKALRAGMQAKEIALYIYTSGTTGLPKAARMTHARCQTMLRSMVVSCKSIPSDRVLIALPLYHATGGLVAAGCALMAGAAIVLERKFSANKFWKIAIETSATNFVYIGEMGRYLMNCEITPDERQHKITRCFGNGLRADVWSELVERTGIQRVYEFYGATEGNVNLLNVDNKIGAIGRVPDILRKKLPTRVIKVDNQTEEVIRNQQGFCSETEANEVGEAIGKIDPSANRQRFEGYRDKSKNESKIVNNVFEEGDSYFRTGDLMRRDKDGYLYFVDRLGDTYRWKAENVSTNEVSEVLSSFEGVELANVYGVEVKGHEGRAGMAAIQLANEIDLAALWAYVRSELPEYARPVFIRILETENTTGTFKFKKVDLVKEGFDPNTIKFPIFVSSAEDKSYVKLTADIFEAIQKGERRL